MDRAEHVQVALALGKVGTGHTAGLHQRACPWQRALRL